MTTKEKILIAAAEEFAEKGFNVATIRDICENAGVNVAAVNYHFSSKNILYEKVFEFLLKKTEKNNPPLVNLEFRNETEWWDEIRAFLRRMLKKSISDNKYDRYLHTIFAMEELYPSEHFSSIYSRLLAPRLQNIKKLFSYSDIKTEEELYICVISIISIVMNFSEKKALISQITGNERFGSDHLDLIIENLFSGIKASMKYKGFNNENKK